MGVPIKVQKKESPTDEEIDEIHQKLMDDMTILFDKYKGLYGWKDKKLIIE